MKRIRQPHFFGAWRKKRDLTQEDVETTLGWSQSKASRLEKAETPFSQDDLEAAAELYKCDVVDLLKTDPNDPNSLWAVFVEISKAPAATKEQMRAYGLFLLGRRE